MNHNFLIVTLDSCRWDVFSTASIEALRSLLEVQECEALATYTLPSHICMLQGHFPQSMRRLPYFNRFVQSVFRINSDGLPERSSLVQFPTGTRNIVTGLRAMNYRTLVVGAVSWFKSPLLTESFESVCFTGIDVAAQSAIVREFADTHAREPRFVLWNVGETHDPFEFRGRVREQATMRKLLRDGAAYDPKLAKELVGKQTAALEYAAQFVAETIRHLERSDSTSESNWTSIVCADHGECFGENGYFGHGFYNPLIMKVPLGIRIARLPES